MARSFATVFKGKQYLFIAPAFQQPLEYISKNFKLTKEFARFVDPMTSL